MKLRLIAVFTAVFMAAASVSLVSYGDEEQTNLLAFPGAEGGGKYSQGARANGTVEIYHVTNLEDYDPLTETAVEGSLRDALSESGRIVVFDTDGAIHLTSQLLIPSNTTILGQTAPGEGITLTGYDVLAESGASDIILRYIRVRPTDDNGGEPDGLGGRWNNNVIFDHCSVSWSVDEAITLYAGTSEDENLEQGRNITVQNSIISESLRMSSHIKGAHGYGGITGGNNSTFYHNLMAHHDSRTPRVDREVNVAEITNNIVYNWGYTNSAYGGEPYSYHDYTQLETNINYTNNYYSYGPSTRTAIRNRIYDVSNSNHNADTHPYKANYYFDGNYVYGYSAVTADNSQGVNNTSAANLVDTEFDMGDYALTNPETAQEAYSTILETAGATLPKRDAIDARIVYDVENMTGRIVNNASEVGGMIDINAGATEQRTFTVDESWKTEKGLSSYSDGDIITEGEFAGYVLLEAYVNDRTEEQEAPTNPEITVLSPAIASVNSTVNGQAVDNGNRTVITEEEALNYNAVASAVGSAAVTSMELYDGNDLIGSYSGSSINDDISLEPGTHYLTSRAYNSKGEKTQSTTSIVYVKAVSEDLGDYSFTEIGKGSFAGEGGAALSEDGSYTIYGSGYLVNSNSGGTRVSSDSCSYIYKAVEGDFDVSLKVLDIPKFDNRQNNGIMFRETLDANSRMGMITDTWITNGENDKYLTRTTTGGASTSYFFTDESGSDVTNSSSGENHAVAKYMRITREGDDITFYLSQSGSDWTDDERQPVTVTYTDLADTVYIGYATDSSEILATKPYFAISSFTFDCEPEETDNGHSTDSGFYYDSEFLMKDGGGDWVVSSDGSIEEGAETAYETSDDVSGNDTVKLAVSDKAVQIAIPEEYQSGSYVIEYDFLTTNTAEAGRSFRTYLDNAVHAYDEETGQATEYGNGNAFFHMTDIGSIVYTTTAEADIAAGSVTDTMNKLCGLEADKWYHITLESENGGDTATVTIALHSADGTYDPENISEPLYSGTVSVTENRDTTAKQLKFMRTAGGILYYDNISFSALSDSEETTTEDSTESTTETPAESTTAAAKGDVDGRDGLTANDAACVLYYVFNDEEVNPKWNITNETADLNGDGVINAADAALILAKVLNPALQIS
ncbi:MAG: dockerin type I domain-containing protein [Clostridiales bacterium]|nr:dockerin type I domain-containing protein [Clostridiales bacterium]